MRDVEKRVSAVHDLQVKMPNSFLYGRMMRLLIVLEIIILVRTLKRKEVFNRAPTYRCV